jgi:hypothetical protein
MKFNIFLRPHDEHRFEEERVRVDVDADLFKPCYLCNDPLTARVHTNKKLNPCGCSEAKDYCDKVTGK